MPVPNATAAAVLAYLYDSPQSGWDIAHGLQDLVGEFWNVAPSQVYRELKAMAEAGLVEAGEPGPRDRRPYAITEDGRAEFDVWLGQLPEPDVVRIPLLLKLFLGADRLGPEELASFVAEHRQVHEERLERYERACAELDAAGVNQAHVARYGIFHERAVLGWMDTLPWTK